MTQAIVVGRHRTGTSMLAGVLHHLGLATGPRAPEAAFAPPSNPLGQFEDDEFVNVMARMMGNWRVPELWRMTEEAVDDFERLVAERDAEHMSWTLKSPQLCIAGQYVLHLFSSPIVFLIHRDFEASVASLAKRDGMPIPVASHLQSLYATHLDSLSGYLIDHAIPTYMIAYEDMLAQPEFFVDRIIEALDLAPDEFTRARAIAHVTPELRHH